MNAALAVLSGVLLGISFPRFGVSLASFIALFPLMWALRPAMGAATEPVPVKTAFRLGYLTGAVFFLVLLYWVPRLPPENVTIPFVMYPATALLVAYLAVYPALTAAGSAWLARRGLPVGISFPLVWTLLEAFRGTGTLGFPWGSLGYALATYPHLVQFAEFTGIWGATLWVVGINGAVHQYLSTRWVKPKLLSLLVLVVLIVGPYLHGQHVLANREPRSGVEVGIVQPNIGNNKWKASVRDSVVKAILDHTAELARENPRNRPAMIVWPETAIPARLTRDAYYRRWVEAAVDSIGIPVLTGFPDGVRLEDGTLRFTNSAALIQPGLGITKQYDKRHLVPFSEDFAVPFLNRFDFGQSNFTRGSRPGNFDGPGPPFGLLICFESIFPGEARDVCRGGARYLVNITNDQWFGDSAAPIQHFNMNVFRCIENRVGMVRSANTGISGVIDPYGIVRVRTGTFVPERRVVAVELGREPTFYRRYGDWILVVAGVALALLTGATFLPRRKPA